jgi:hypothetical protein
VLNGGLFFRWWSQVDRLIKRVRDVECFTTQATLIDYREPFVFESRAH